VGTHEERTPAVDLLRGLRGLGIRVAVGKESASSHLDTASAARIGSARSTRRGRRSKPERKARRVRAGESRALSPSAASTHTQRPQQAAAGHMPRILLPACVSRRLPARPLWLLLPPGRPAGCVQCPAAGAPQHPRRARGAAAGPPRPARPARPALPWPAPPRPAPLAQPSLAAQTASSMQRPGGARRGWGGRERRATRAARAPGPQHRSARRSARPLRQPPPPRTLPAATQKSCCLMSAILGGASTKSRAFDGP